MPKKILSGEEIYRRQAVSFQGRLTMHGEILAGIFVCCSIPTTSGKCFVAWNEGYYALFEENCNINRFNYK